MIGVAILGSTGSVGSNTLAVMGEHPERFRATALCANTNVEQLLAQCLDWRPRFAVMRDPTAAERLQTCLGEHGLSDEITVLSGDEGLVQVATCAETDYVMAAIVGAAGLPSTIAAARAGKRVLLANKESLVMAGQLFMHAVRDGNACLLPIDSEHNALFQCLPVGLATCESSGVARLLLTGSGGPFLRLSRAALSGVTPDQALAHPNWVMGRKISIDSATMMNKGLELIEACWLFDVMLEQIEIVIHPQSVIHSMVEYIDGSVIAQLGQPDMRTPIAHALAWPQRLASGVERLAFEQLRGLDFQRPDEQQFPCLRLAREAHIAGGSASTVLNAANEVAVATFLAGTLAFTDIAAVIEATLEDASITSIDSLDDIYAADAMARELACEQISRVGAQPVNRDVGAVGRHSERP